jgi:hypothetical protein
MHALSQLSYGPWNASKCSGELEIFRPVHAEALIVSRAGEPQPNLRPTRKGVVGKEVAAFGVRVDAELGSGLGDRELRDRAFLVGRKNRFRP